MVANGSTYRELYKSDLFELEMGVPPIDEQDAIIEALSALQFLSLLGPALEQSMTESFEMLRIQREDRGLRSLTTRIGTQLISGRLSSAELLSRV